MERKQKALSLETKYDFWQYKVEVEVEVEVIILLSNLKSSGLVDNKLATIMGVQENPLFDIYILDVFL